MTFMRGSAGTTLQKLHFPAGHDSRRSVAETATTKLVVTQPARRDSHATSFTSENSKCRGLLFYRRSVRQCRDTANLILIDHETPASYLYSCSLPFRRGSTKTVYACFTIVTSAWILLLLKFWVGILRYTPMIHVNPINPNVDNGKLSRNCSSLLYDEMFIWTA
jgi:hypothetical protein